MHRRRESNGEMCHGNIVEELEPKETKNMRHEEGLDYGNRKQSKLRDRLVRKVQSCHREVEILEERQILQIPHL